MLGNLKKLCGSLNCEMQVSGDRGCHESMRNRHTSVIVCGDKHNLHTSSRAMVGSHVVSHQNGILLTQEVERIHPSQLICLTQLKTRASERMRKIKEARRKSFLQEVWHHFIGRVKLAFSCPCIPLLSLRQHIWTLLRCTQHGSINGSGSLLLDKEFNTFHNLSCRLHSPVHWLKSRAD